MNIFDFLTFLGGLSLFLFGMSVMGNALESRAGDKLKNILYKLTNKKSAGFITGIGVTAIIQSSSATTVMMVGFVNSGLINLKQAINVIMGANIGTTITAWILSLNGINSSNIILKLLKPTSFAPILSLLGIFFYLFNKTAKKKDTGLILLGFSVLIFGMDTMSDAVSVLGESPVFKEIFIAFKNPFLALLAGTLLTAVIQSSSASVGILQALSVTGQISYSTAIPIIMGQNIGTCVTALLSSFGANRNAKRAAFVHLLFNLLGSVILMTVFIIVKSTLSPLSLERPATYSGIAATHTVFNILCTLILLPMSSRLEKLTYKLIPQKDTETAKS